MTIRTLFTSILFSFFLCFSVAVSAADSQVNINQADAAELAQMLHGVGAKKAAAIVAYRERIGGFTSLEQITEVKGIGEAMLSRNRDKMTLGLPAADTEAAEQ